MKAPTTIKLSSSVLFLLFMSACADKPVQENPIPVSPWGGSYTFSYTPAEQKEVTPVKINLAILTPSYKEDGSAFSDQTYAKVGRGFATSMASDLNKILISKGVTTMGPYASHDEITLADKKDISLILAPKILITTQVIYLDANGNIDHYGNRGNYSTNDVVNSRSGRHGKRNTTSSANSSVKNGRQFMLKVNGTNTFIIKNISSEESLWVNKFDLEEVVSGGREINTKGTVEYDGKPDALADAIKQDYPLMMDYFTKSISSEVLLKLRKDAKQMHRQKKHY